MTDRKVIALVGATGARDLAQSLALDPLLQAVAQWRNRNKGSSKNPRCPYGMSPPETVPA